MRTTPRHIHHPLFARMYARMAAGFEAKGGAEHRRELLAGTAGRAVEVGAGTGLNFGHYPPAVNEVVAVEPEPFLRARAIDAARHAVVPIHVVDGTADALPAEDGAFDVAVASLVLCSVPDPSSALAEIHRVLRPGGELRFYEHVSSDRPGFRLFQRCVDVIWPLFAGGCHVSRATDQAIAQKGFDVDAERSFTFRPSLLTLPAAPHVIGTARRRDVKPPSR